MATWSARVGASSDDAYALGSAAPDLTSANLQIGNNSSLSIATGWRLTGVGVAQGATINSAFLTITASVTYTTGSTLSAIVSGQAADNAPTFAASAGNLGTGTRPRTTAATGALNLQSVTAEIEYVINVTSIIQELVNRPGWASGNSLVLIADNNGSANGEWQDFYSYNGSPGKAALLEIVYTTGGGGSSPIPAPRVPLAILAR